MFSVVNKWEKGDTVLRQKKIKIYPNKEQKKILNNWFGTSRFVYNRLLNAINDPSEYYKTFNNDEDPLKYEVNLSQLFNEFDYMNFYSMRNHYVTKKNNNHLYNWEFETPKDIRAGSLKQLISNFKSAFTNKRKQNIVDFKIKYKSKKNIHKSITIPKYTIKINKKSINIFSTFIKEPLKVKSRTQKQLKDIKIEHDCKLIYDGLGFFLLVPYKKKVKTKKDKKKIVALDPGVRTFQTGYSKDRYFKSESRTKILKKYYKKIDILKSLRKGRKAVLKLGAKIRNTVNDIHWKTINYLTKKYNDVLLPNFESQEMCKKRQLNKSTNRIFMSLQHYKFKQRLIDKTKETINFRVHIVREDYTSKTCTNCGNINNNLKGKKIYTCENCSLSIDRDINGARNILLKYLQ